MTLTFQDLFKMLLKRWWVILIGVVATSLIMFIYSSVIMTEKYESSVAFRVNYSGGGNQNTGDVSFSEKMAQGAVDIINTDSFFDELSKKIKSTQYPHMANDVSVESNSLKAMIKATNKTGTPSFSVVVTAKDSKIAYEIAICVQEIVPEYVSKYLTEGTTNGVTRENFKPYDFPKENPKAVSPNVLMYTIIGFLIGGILAVLIIFLIEKFDVRIKNETDLETHISLPILGTVPRFLDEEEVRK